LTRARRSRHPLVRAVAPRAAGGGESAEAKVGEFERRKEAFEAFFALSETLRFKALARRNRAVGRWAAEKLALTGEAAERYAEGLAQAQIDGADDEALVARLNDEFAKAGVDVSAHRIRRRFEAALAQAVADVQAGR
jgi:hypothetical protein